MGGKRADTPVTYAIVAQEGVLVETVAQPSAPRPALPMRSDDAIVIRGLGKVFHPIELRLRSLHPLRRHPPICALREISLAVRRGEVLGLLGTNGAGKTTLLKILATLILPNAGHAIVHGWDVVQDAGHVKRIVGLVTGDERSFYWPRGRGLQQSWPGGSRLSHPLQARRGGGLGSQRDVRTARRCFLPGGRAAPLGAVARRAQPDRPRGPWPTIGDLPGCVRQRPREGTRCADPVRGAARTAIARNLALGFPPRAVGRKPEPPLRRRWSRP